MTGPTKGAYTLTGIDPDLWRQVKAAAALQGQTLREWILAKMEASLPPRAIVRADPLPEREARTVIVRTDPPPKVIVRASRKAKKGGSR